MTATNGFLARLGGQELSGLVGGSAFFFISRVAGAVLAYVTQIVLARWMGATELGAYVFAFSLFFLVSKLEGHTIIPSPCTPEIRSSHFLKRCLLI